MTGHQSVGGRLPVESDLVRVFVDPALGEEVDHACEVALAQVSDCAILGADQANHPTRGGPLF